MVWFSRVSYIVSVILKISETLLMVLMDPGHPKDPEILWCLLFEKLSQTNSFNLFGVGTTSLVREQLLVMTQLLDAGPLQAYVTTYRQKLPRVTSHYAAELQPALHLLEMGRRLMWRHVIATSTGCTILVFFLEASHSSCCERRSRVLDGPRVWCSLYSYSYKFGSANGRIHQ